MDDIINKKQKNCRSYSYQLDKNNDQIFKAMILSFSKLDSNETIETLRSKGDVITADEVKNWFPKKFFEPTNEEIQFYTDQLNILRVTMGYDQKQIDDDDSERIVFESMEKLRKHLPKTIHSTIQSIESNDPRQSMDLKKKNLYICNHLIILQEVINHYYSIYRYFGDGEDLLSWYNDAFFLMFLLLECTKKRKIKPSIKWVNSPIISIIQKSLARTKVATVSNDAVVKAIKKYPRYPFLRKYLREYTK